MHKKQVAVRLSDDYYKAFVTIRKDEDFEKVKAQDVLDALKEKSVVYGLDYKTIDQICASDEDVFEALVAQGVPHEHGADARIDYQFDAEHKSKPEILEDGTVNFKNMGFVHAVAAGTVLARKIPATKGITGTTVTGRAIQGREGKDKAFSIGKNVHISEDGSVVISDIDGRLSFDGKKIEVLSVFEVQGDVGVATGNVEFIGSVVVNGNICDGYEVSTTGDLTVNGVVEGAVLKVGGDLTVSRGIQGHDDAVVTVSGNVVTNFINAANLNVSGDIETNAITSSVIKCDGNVELKGKKGQLIGGELTCKGNLVAKTVGSELEVITDIKLGIDAELVDEMKELTTEIKSIGTEIENQGKEVVTLANRLKVNPDDEKIKFVMLKLKASYDQLQTVLKEKKARYNMLQEYANKVSGAALKAGLIYPGVKVRIGSSNYFVKNALTNTIIKKDKGEVVATSY